MPFKRLQSPVSSHGNWTPLLTQITLLLIADHEQLQRTSVPVNGWIRHDVTTWWYSWDDITFSRGFSKFVQFSDFNNFQIRPPSLPPPTLADLPNLASNAAKERTKLQAEAVSSALTTAFSSATKDHLEHLLWNITTNQCQIVKQHCYSSTMTIIVQINRRKSLAGRDTSQLASWEMHLEHLILSNIRTTNGVVDILANSNSHTKKASLGFWLQDYSSLPVQRHQMLAQSISMNASFQVK